MKNKSKKTSRLSRAAKGAVTGGIIGVTIGKFTGPLFIVAGPTLAVPGAIIGGIAGFFSGNDDSN